MNKEIIINPPIKTGNGQKEYHAGKEKVKINKEEDKKKLLKNRLILISLGTIAPIALIATSLLMELPMGGTLVGILIALVIDFIILVIITEVLFLRVTTDNKHKRNRFGGITKDAINIGQDDNVSVLKEDNVEEIIYFSDYHAGHEKKELLEDYRFVEYRALNDITSSKEYLQATKDDTSHKGLKFGTIHNDVIVIKLKNDKGLISNNTKTTNIIADDIHTLYEKTINSSTR